MPPYRCEKGCKNQFGTRKIHSARWECKFESTYDPVRLAKKRARGAPASEDGVKPTPAEGAAVPPSSTRPPEPPGSSDAVTLPESKSTGGVLTFADKTAETVRRGDIPEVVSQDWILDEEHNETAWATVLSIIGRIVHFIDNALEIEPMKDVLFQINAADRQLIKGAPRRLMTSALKRAGNKTLQEAQNSVDTFGGLAMFGTLAVQIGTHYVRGVKTSPVLKARRAKRAEQTAAARASGALPAGSPVRGWWSRREPSPRSVPVANEIPETVATEVPG